MSATIQMPVVAAASIAAAREICRKHNRDLFLASFFLPAQKRAAIHAVFAFGWLIDQAIDESSCADDSIQSRLDLFRDRLDEIYDGRFEFAAVQFRDQTQHILAAFADAIARYEIPRQYFIDWAEGCRMDRTIRRYATWGSLEKYLYQSGGVRALAMSCILGLQNSEGGNYAISLGNAIRLTNILANLKQDAERGRIYLPLEDLARFGYPERELTGGIVSESFRKLMTFEIARARELYRAGAEGICWLADDGSRAAAAIITVQSSSVLQSIENHGYNVFDQSVRSRIIKMLLRLPNAWRLARRAPDQPLPRI